MTETFHANEYEVNSKLIYSIPLQKVLSKVKQNSASLMDECKVGGHTRTFLIISAKAPVVCIIHLRRAHVRGADASAVMYLHEQTPEYKCEVIDEETCRERTCASIWKSQGHVLHHYQENTKSRAGKQKSKIFPSEQKWHLWCRCCVPTFCTTDTASEARCYVKPPAYCANSNKLLSFDSLGKTQVVSFAMQRRKIFDKSLGVKGSWNPKTNFLLCPFYKM